MILNSPFQFGPPPWTPADLPDNLGWWDASDSATIALTSGRVSQWSAKVGSNHFVQATAANRPVVSGSTLNGRPLINSDGINRWMDLTTRLTNVRTAAILCKWTDKTGNYRFIFGDIPAGDVDYHGAEAAKDDLFEFAPVGGAGNNYINGVLTAGNLERYTAWTRHIFIPLVNTKIGNFAQDRGGVFGDRCFKGDVAEIVLLSSAMTSDDRTKLNTYWATKYAL